jgi:multidrug resistance protein
MGIMPIFWASLCDYLGRRPIYLISMFIFILGSIFAAIARNIWVFFFMRLIQAVGSSSVLAVGGGSLGDVFHSSERGTAFGLYYLGPLVAPMIGPIIGGVISDRVGWRYLLSSLYSLGNIYSLLLSQAIETNAIGLVPC